jgi:hypothetical protein
VWNRERNAVTLLLGVPQVITARCYTLSYGKRKAQTFGTSFLCLRNEGIWLGGGGCGVGAGGRGGEGRM